MSVEVRYLVERYDLPVAGQIVLQQDAGNEEQVGAARLTRGQLVLALDGRAQRLRVKLSAVGHHSRLVDSTYCRERS